MSPCGIHQREAGIAGVALFKLLQPSIGVDLAEVLHIMLPRETWYSGEFSRVS